MLLFGDPLLGGLEAITAAGFGLAALAEKAVWGAGSLVRSGSNGAGAAGEHTFDDEFGLVAEEVAVFVEIVAPAIVMLEQQLLPVGEYTWCRVYRAVWDRKRAPAQPGSRRRRAHFMRVYQRGTGIEVRLQFKDGRGSSAAVLAPKGRYVHHPP